jgi:hypothetical protein
MRLITVTMSVAAPFCLAQGSGDFKPATTNAMKPNIRRWIAARAF